VLRRFTMEEVTLIGACRCMPGQFRDVVDALASGRLGAHGWHETRPLAEGPAARVVPEQGEVGSAEVVLVP
jgi:alcohol dehydrogenase